MSLLSSLKNALLADLRAHVDALLAPLKADLHASLRDLARRITDLEKRLPPPPPAARA